MFEVFKNYISGRIALSDEEYARIESSCIFKKLRKGQYLLQEGEVWRYNAFITKGLVRVFTVDDKGIEHILSFAKENWWTGDRASLMSGTPSRFNIETLEPSEVILIEKTSFDTIRRDIPAFDGMIYNIIEKSFVVAQERILIAKDYTAEEKYLDFIRKYADYPLRVPQHMIASYLGITPETLSRIKSQTTKKGS